MARDVTIRYIGDSSSLERASQRAAAAAETIQSRFQRAGDGLQRFGRRTADIGKKWSTRVSLPIVAGLAVVTNAASDQNEAISAADAVFGKNAKAIQRWSKTTAAGFGVSRTEALGAATGFQNFFLNAGIADKAATKMSPKLVELAADMASFHNEDPSDMLERFRSGLAGEVEPLRRFGINLSAAEVAQKAVSMGLAENASEVSENAKVQARYQLLLEKTSRQQGDFARTSDGVANQQRILKARLTDAAAALGTKLLPVAQKLAEWATKAIEWFEGLSEGTKTWILRFAGVAAAVGPVLIVLGKLSQGLGALIKIAPLVGKAMTGMFGPWGLAAAAAIAIVILVIKHWDKIKAAAFAVRDALVSAFGAVVDWLKNNWEKIVVLLAGPVGLAVVAIVKHWDKIKNATMKAWNAVKDFLSKHWKKILTAFLLFLGPAGMVGAIALNWKKVSDLTKKVWDKIKRFFADVWRRIKDIFGSAIGWVRDRVSSGFTRTRDTVLNIMRRVREGISDAWKRIKNTVGGAVGWIREKITSVFKRAKDRALDIFRALRDGVGTVWSRISDTVKSAINRVIDVINTLIGGVNTILRAVGLDRFQIGKLGHVGATTSQRPRTGGGGGGGTRPLGLAQGGPVPVGPGFMTNGPTAIVGEGRRQHPEFVIPTDPAYRDRALGLYAALGNKLMPKMFLGGILGKAFDIGKAAIGKIGDVAEFLGRKALVGLFSPVNSAVRSGLNAIPNVLHMRDMAQRIREVIWNWVKGADSALPEMPTGGGGTAKGLVGYARAAFAFWRNMFPSMTIGGWRAQGSVPGSDHPKGKALDLMTFSNTIAQQIIRIFKNQAGAKYWIWNRQAGDARNGWAIRSYFGPSPHTDHVHLSYFHRGGKLTEDVTAVGHRTGRMYQMQAGEIYARGRGAGRIDVRFHITGSGRLAEDIHRGVREGKINLYANGQKIKVAR